MKEISEALDIPEGTIKSRLSRAREFLKVQLSEEEKRPATGKNKQAIKENNRKGENVMLEKKWNNIAPEVPQDFHNKFEDTLKQIEQADSADKKYKEKKSVADY